MPKRVVRPNGSCRVCVHPERVRIEMLKASGASVRALGKKYAIPFHSIHRHWENHVSEERRAGLILGPVQRQALATRVAEESGSVIDHYKAVRAGLYQLYDAAIEAGDRVGGAMLAGKLHENFASIGRLTGQLAMSPLVQINQQTTNVFVNDPRFAEFQARLIAVLARHPGARAEVIAEFERLDGSEVPTPVPAVEFGGG